MRDYSCPVQPLALDIVTLPPCAGLWRMETHLWGNIKFTCKLHSHKAYSKKHIQGRKNKGRRFVAQASSMPNSYCFVVCFLWIPEDENYMYLRNFGRFSAQYTDIFQKVQLLLKNAAFWDVNPWSFCENRRFGRTCLLRHEHSFTAYFSW
jgi:hypothetical protein